MPDENGKPTFALTWEMINNRVSETAGIFDYSMEATQNGQVLEEAYYMDEEPEGYNSLAALESVDPGESFTQVTGFVLIDESSPVTIEVSGLFDFEKELVVTYVFTL